MGRNGNSDGTLQGLRGDRLVTLMGRNRPFSYVESPVPTHYTLPPTSTVGGVGGGRKRDALVSALSRPGQ